MEDLLLQWSGLVGFAALVAFAINILKTFGVVKDAQAQNWSAGLNLLLLAGLLALRVFAPDFDVSGLNAQAQAFVDVGVVIFSYILQLLGSKAAHTLLRGLPLIGKSFSR